MDFKLSVIKIGFLVLIETMASCKMREIESKANAETNLKSSENTGIPELKERMKCEEIQPYIEKLLFRIDIWTHKMIKDGNGKIRNGYGIITGRSDDPFNFKMSCTWDGYSLPFECMDSMISPEDSEIVSLFKVELFTKSTPIFDKKRYFAELTVRDFKNNLEIRPSFMPKKVFECRRVDEEG